MAPGDLEHNRPCPEQDEIAFLVTLDVIVEAPRPAHRRVERFDAVGRPDHGHPAPRFQPVQKHQQLREKLHLVLMIRRARRGAMLSSSSIKTTLGANCRARANSLRKLASLSPTHLERISGPLINSKWALLSVATAFARRVLPLPGGPYKRTPLWGSTRNASK